MLLLLAVGANAAAPQLEWSFETQGKIYASPIIVDLDNDGSPEIIIAASRAQTIFCLDGRGGQRWSYTLDDGMSDGFQATPSAADYDSDGKKEVFWLTRGGTAGCLDAQGKLIWRVFLNDQFDYTAPVLADLNNDDRLEIVFGSESGTLYCLDDTGVVQWRYQSEGSIRGVPGVAKINGVGRVYATFGGGLEACFDAEGNILWQHKEGLPRGQRWSAVAIGDLDADGRQESVCATEDFQVIARDAETGEERWRFKGKGNIDQTCSFALADFDNSGKLDVVTGDSSGNVYRIGEGQVVWSADVRDSIVQGPSIGDVDGDGALEILVCSRSNRLVCLSQDGQEQWQYATEAAPLTTPALGDVDQDGQIEIIFTAKDRFVRCLSVNGEAAHAKLPWPMLAHDPQLSNNVTGAAFTPPPPAESILDTPLFSIDHFAPLHMGNNRIPVHFRNNSFRGRHLEAVVEVKCPEGNVVSKTISHVCEPYETADSHLELMVLMGGEYALSARLLDVGTGALLDTVQDSATVVPFEEERREAGELEQTAAALIREIQDVSLKQRAEAACHQAQNALNKALDDFSDSTTIKNKVQCVQIAATMLKNELARLYAIHATPVPVWNFAVVPETTLRKVFQDEPCLTSLRVPQTIRIHLARNEYEGAQVIVVPLWSALKQVIVKPGALKQENGPGTIPEGNIHVQRVGYVPIGPSEYNFRVEKQGLYPDVLFSEDPVDIPASQCAQPYFVTVKTEMDTLPGDYSGTIDVVAGENALSIPIQVHVWDFALPKETTLKTSFWMNEGYIKAFYNYPDRVPFDVRKKFYDLHLEHRMSPIKDFSMDLLEDFEYLMTHGQNCFFIPIPDKMEPDKMEAYKKNVLETRAFLQEKGWADKALFYSRDEVAVMARHLIPDVMEMNAWIKSFLPEWPRLETSAPEQALAGGVDIWCPTIDNFNPAFLKTRMAQGDRLWMYTVWGRPGIMIEFPATDHRLMFWECWKYGAEGFLYWGTTHWDLNTQGEERWPARPWITYNRQPGHNGCGYMVYPGPDGTPLPSVRMSVARDGIEDFEYFTLLQSLLTSKGALAPEPLRKQAEEELAVDPKVVMDNKRFTENPEDILNARARIAELIERLKKH
ncbi:MAG TPA: FG-GAP-like repeat-containing protein [Candidatus Hydrogenedentes bacterium]|nr:FG-GAP-like repeat-containing protein [Candidatus Hydrogenedentota bacterium]